MLHVAQKALIYGVHALLVILHKTSNVRKQSMHDCFPLLFYKLDLAFGNRISQALFASFPFIIPQIQDTEIPAQARDVRVYRKFGEVPPPDFLYVLFPVCCYFVEQRILCCLSIFRCGMHQDFVIQEVATGANTTHMDEDREHGSSGHVWCMWLGAVGVRLMRRVQTCAGWLRGWVVQGGGGGARARRKVRVGARSTA